jgi:hypothetical protein
MRVSDAVTVESPGFIVCALAMYSEFEFSVAVVPPIVNAKAWMSPSAVWDASKWCVEIPSMMKVSADLSTEGIVPSRSSDSVGCNGCFSSVSVARVFVPIRVATGRSDVVAVPTVDNSDCANVRAMSSEASFMLEGWIRPMSWMGELSRKNRTLLGETIASLEASSFEFCRTLVSTAEAGATCDVVCSSVEDGFGATDP